MNEVGATFAGYRLDQLLSTDTVSSIYRATPRHARGNGSHPVALRVTHPLCVADGPDVDAIAIYIRRLSAALKVNHPALAPITDAGDTDDRVYAATALIDGVTLGHHVRDHGRIAPDTAIALLRELADGLDSAHAAGVVHAAISPRTILIRRTGSRPPTAVLCGFGIDTLLARQARHDRDHIDIRDVQYVAPEQLHGSNVDGRADQYALACALYHCATGTTPFVRETASAMFGAHLFSVAATTPLDDDPALRQALMAGLGKRVDERYGSCVDLLAAAGQRGTATPHAVAARGSESRGASGGPGASPDASPGTSPDASSPPAHRGDVRPGSSRHRAAARPGGGRGRSAPHDRSAGSRSRWSIVSWPIAAMVVLVGIVTTLALYSVLRHDGEPGRTDADGVAVDGGGSADGALAAAGEAPAAGLRWQRALTDEALYALRVVGDTLVAAAPHTVVALDAERGTSAWRRPIDVGVLTDIAVTDQTVALRAATFRALALDTGRRAWDKADVVAPISSLTALDGVLYGVGPGRLTPELVALEAATGDPVWYYDGGPESITDDTAVVAGGGIVALLDGDGVAVVDPAGSTSRADDGRIELDGERWRTDIVDPWPDALAVLPDAVVVADHTGQVCAYDPADGALRWCRIVEGLAEQEPSIIAVGDTIVVALESTVTALALESGATRWTFDAPDALHPIVAGAGGQVVVADVKGRAHGLDLDRGFEAWRASGVGEVTALAATDDAIYIGTRDGEVARLRPPATGQHPRDGVGEDAL